MAEATIDPAAPAPPQEPDAPKAEKAEKKPKEKKGKAEKKGKSPAAEGARPSLPTIAAHPRAARSVARAKGWGGLGGFLLAGYLSMPTHDLAEAAMRALIAGTISYVAVWAGAVFIWRRLVVIELKSREAAAMQAVIARQALAVPEPQSAGDITASRSQA